MTRRATYVRLFVVLAPVLMGAAMLTDLTPQTNTTEELLDAVRDQPGRWLLTGTLFLLAGLAWTVAGIGLHTILAKRSRNVRVGAIALAAGGASLALIDAAGFYLPSVASSAASIEHQVAIVESVEATVPVLALEIIHIVGWAMGLVLVAIGLWAARVTSRWIPVLLFVSIAGMVAASGVALMVVAAVHVAALSAVAAQLPRALEPSQAPAPSAVPA